MSVPNRAQAESAAYAAVLSAIVADLNVKLSSKQNVSFLSQASLTKFGKDLKGWNLSLSTENVPVTTGDIAGIAFAKVTYLVVS